MDRTRITLDSDEVWWILKTIQGAYDGGCSFDRSQMIKLQNKIGAANARLNKAHTWKRIKQ